MQENIVTSIPLSDGREGLDIEPLNPWTPTHEIISSIMAKYPLTREDDSAKIIM